MGDQGSERGSFWTSLPGILTGAAALVTAISGLAIWHNRPSPQPAPQPGPVVQQTVQPSTPGMQQIASPPAAGPGSQVWCTEKYKAWSDEKQQSGVDNPQLRKAILSHHCNTNYGFGLGKPGEQTLTATQAATTQPAAQKEVVMKPVASASTNAEPGSQPWCAEKYKAWADEKAQTGVDDAALRKAIMGQHCNTKYGFVLGRIQQH